MIVACVGKERERERAGSRAATDVLAGWLERDPDPDPRSGPAQK